MYKELYKIINETIKRKDDEMGISEIVRWFIICASPFAMFFLVVKLRWGNDADWDLLKRLVCGVYLVVALTLHVFAMRYIPWTPGQSLLGLEASVSMGFMLRPAFWALQSYYGEVTWFQVHERQSGVLAMLAWCLLPMVFGIL